VIENEVSTIPIERFRLRDAISVISLVRILENDTKGQFTWADLCDPDRRRNKFAQEGTVER